MIRIVIIALVALAGAASVARAQTLTEIEAADNAREYRELTAGDAHIQVSCAVARADTGEPVVVCPSGPIEYMPQAVIDAAYKALHQPRADATIAQSSGTFVPKNWPVEEMPRRRSESGGGPYQRDYGTCRRDNDAKVICR